MTTASTTASSASACICIDGYEKNADGTACVSQKKSCAVGQYLDASNKCVTCPEHYACPDGIEKQACGTIDGVPSYTNGTGHGECTPCPGRDTITNSDYLDSIYTYSGAAGIYACRARWENLPVPHGTVMMTCSYGPSYGYEGVGGASHCLLDVISCDAGYEYKGEYVAASNAYRSWGTGYDWAMTTKWCEPAGTGKYSPDGAIKATDCPPDTMTRTDTASSPDECFGKCTSGATKFHAGALSFQLWDNCPAPALWVGMDGGNCCVNLVAGTAAKAVNVQYDNGATYHTVD